ncbi:MAG: hypothetical protein LBB29_02885 [Holosporaceae bacterium]|nr:hypothetical protein [Holosporaceae bacterium]
MATFKSLYKQVKRLKKCKFYTDDWNGFSAILPKRGRVISKSHTITVEQNNSNTRHYLGHMTRRPKVVSKSEKMLRFKSRLD